MTRSARIIVIGAGVGGLTAAALLAQAGHEVTVLEAQTYPGGSAGTFFHKGYRFDAGATVAGGFQPGGPHALIAEKLGITWAVRAHDPAWVVHLPDRDVRLTLDNADVLAQFPNTQAFWSEQSALAQIGWKLAGQALPWPPGDLAEWARLVRIGFGSLPRSLRLAPFALMSAHHWLGLRGLLSDRIFVRFIDAQLLISAQTTSLHANAAYSATALDLARQGVYHAEGGMGTIARQLAGAVERFGGRVLYRQKVESIEIEQGRVTAVHAKRGERFPADFIIANLTPASLDGLLAQHSPHALQREAETHRDGWGAFVLHAGVRADRLPDNLPDHHQFIASVEGPLGETRSIFLSLSPEWDTSRAPAGYRAATMTTHTDVRSWWDAAAQGDNAYEERKQAYTARLMAGVEAHLPGFSAAAELVLPGTPLTYAFYTGRAQGMVGGFPQSSLFRARGPRTGIPNLRLVGDSVFPDQSTAGVTLGAMRVAADVLRQVQQPQARVNTPAPANRAQP